jgi:hypothetical protein
MKYLSRLIIRMVYITLKRKLWVRDIKYKKKSNEVYDLLGQKAADLISEHFESGRHQVVFDAGNLVSGVYYYKITAGDFIQIKKMMLLK